MGIPQEPAANATAPDDLTRRKADLRAQRRAADAAADPAALHRAGHRAAVRLRRLAAFRRARAVGVYLARGTEPETASLAEDCRRVGRRLAVPAWDRQLEAYRFADWAPDEPLAAGPRDIPQPAAPRWVAAADLDCIVVPGVAFDRGGGRLGHGGGHYDRLLAGPRGVTFGLAREDQCVASVPCGPGDIRLDFIVTEKAVYVAPGARRGRPPVNHPPGETHAL